MASRVVLASLKPDRRQPDRLVPPSCPSCDPNTPMAVATRTDYAVYFRCPGCGRIEGPSKPKMASDLRY